MSNQPFVRIVPGIDGVSIWSPAVFGSSSTGSLREFLARAFSVEEVSTVEIRRATSFGRVNYEASSTNVRTLWRKIGEALKGEPPHADGPAGARRRPLGVEALNLAGRVRAPIRINRVGSAVSTWQLNFQDRHRLRLSHPALRYRRDVAYRLEEELAAILGVTAFRTNVWTSTVAIGFDPNRISAERLIQELEKSWPRLLDGLDGPPSGKRLVVASGLLGLSFTGQYLVPAVRPLAVAGVALYGLPNVLNGSKQLARRQVGLPALYSAGLMFMLFTGMPFSSTVMAVLMQFWPRLAFNTITRHQRRLFAFHRQRPTWANVLLDGGGEVEVDIETLKVGELIAVRGGETIPVDGVVAHGLAAVDEETLTGVAGALDKTPGDPVYAGTVVRDGRLVVRVERIGTDTAAGSIAAQLPHSRIDHLPSAAEVERIANRNAKPALALAALNLAATRLLRPSQAIIRPDYATAPRIAAQMTALYDYADGLHRGIFFRDPAALDRLPATDIYVFDDTPGLERGQIEVTSVMSADPAQADVVLGYAAAAFPRAQNERVRALQACAAARRAPILNVVQRERHAGAVRYRDGADDHLVEIAAPAYLDAVGSQVPPRLAREVASLQLDGGEDEPLLRPLWVLRDHQILGVITFGRGARPEAREIIASLKARNKRARFVYISSQPQAEAEAVAERVGIATVVGNLDLAGKVNALRSLDRRTMWIGDGASPEARSIIAASTVSISVAGAATAPLDRADIVLLQPGLQHLLALRRIGRAHRARLTNDYRALYAANLLGAAGGFLAGFGSLESGLTSNVASGFIYARHWRDLHKLTSRVETRRAKLVSPVRDESDPLAETSTGAGADEFVEYQDLDPETPQAAQHDGI